MFVPLLVSEEGAEADDEEREGTAGGWMSGNSTADECFTYARGEINGEGARFGAGQERVYPAGS